MKAVICIILFWFLGNLEIKAQQKKMLDSLNTVYQNAKHDSTRIQALSYLVGEFRSPKPDTSLILASKALKLAEKTGYDKKNGDIYFNMGVVYRTKAEYKSCIEAGEKALKYFEIQKKKKGVLDVYNMWGVAEQNQGNYPLAIQHYFKALKIAEDAKDKDGLLSVYANIGIVYRLQGDYELAIQYYQQSYNIAQELDKERDMGIALGNIGNVYYSQKKYDRALEYYERNRVIREKLKDKRGLSLVYVNIGSTYIQTNQIDKGLDYCQKSLEIRNELGDKRGVGIVYNIMADAYRKKQEYDKAIEYAELGLEIARNIKAGGEIKEALEMLYMIHKDNEDYKKSLVYFEAHKSFSDSLFSLEKSKAIANLESKVALEKKEQQLTLVEKDNELNKLSAEKNRLEADNTGRELEINKKRAEADRFFALAKDEKNKRKSDSLYALATKTRLEADKLSAENKVQQTETQKQKEAVAFQRIILYLVLAGLLSVLVFAFFIFRSRQKERKSKELLALKNTEIESAYANITLLSNIGKDITASIEIDNIISKTYGHLNTLMDANILVIGIFQENTQSIDVVASIENNERYKPFAYLLTEKNRPAVWCFEHQKEIFSNDWAKDYSTYFPDYQRPVAKAGESASSLVYLPLMTQEKCIGVLAVQSYLPQAYTKQHLEILRNVANYTSIALDNAQIYAQSERLLHNILPKEVAQELKINGKAQPRTYSNVSILFTDFQGFTQIASRMSPARLVENLDYCFKAFDKIMTTFGLEKIKTIGDAYMCVAGLPKENETHAHDAVNAGLAMIAFIKQWKAEKEAKGEENWNLRIGIHTGRVVAGVVGEAKFAYDIWGDAVNIAARMESSGEPNQLNISEITYTLIKDSFDCTPRGKVQAKGKGEMEMYFVNNKKLLL